MIKGPFLHTKKAKNREGTEQQTFWEFGELLNGCENYLAVFNGVEDLNLIENECKIVLNMIYNKSRFGTGLAQCNKL